MSTLETQGFSQPGALIAATVASILLAACTAAPLKPDGSLQAREKLTRLQADPNLASRAPVAIKEAEVAVRLAETPQPDKELEASHVYIADRKVDTAEALAQTRYAEDQLVVLQAQGEKSRLDARTREADQEKRQAALARREGAEDRADAVQARLDTGAAQTAAASSDLQSAELQRQIDLLRAKPTDRGLVLTLGDVMFMSGRADLKSGTQGNLNKLVAFLDKYPDRTAVIEGYTDSVGSEDYNQGLSERRADSVRSYLVGQGIASPRLVSSGKGESNPVASNDSASGRQENRRVEVVIDSNVALR
jgi:outer membrane protein OmpA-like peptidoglycan-associated protein